MLKNIECVRTLDSVEVASVFGGNEEENPMQLIPFLPEDRDECGYPDPFES